MVTPRRYSDIVGHHYGGAILFHIFYRVLNGLFTPVHLAGTLDGNEAVIVDNVDGQLYEVTIRPLNAIVWDPAPEREEVVE